MSFTIPYVGKDKSKPYISVGFVLENGVYVKARRFLASTGVDVVLVDKQVVAAFGVKTTRKRPKRIIGDRIRFGGQSYPLSFADVEFSLEAKEGILKWNGIACFWDAPVSCGIFGQYNALDLFDTTFQPINEQLVLEPNAKFDNLGGLAIHR